MTKEKLRQWIEERGGNSVGFPQWPSIPGETPWWMWNRGVVSQAAFMHRIS